MLEFSGDNLYIVLGFACNGACKHCSQNERLALNDLVSPCVSESFLKFLISWLKQKPRNIYFYGGEPFLYFEQIINIVSKVNEYNLRNNANFFVFTNGLNLNHDIVNFVNNNRICVILSFDGPNENFLRSKVPDESSLKYWNAISCKRINAVISAGNPDAVKSVLYLKNKFSIDLSSIGFNLLRVHWNMPNYLYDFSAGEISRMINNVIRYENVNHLLLDHWMHKILKRYLNKETEMFSKFICTSCRNGYEVLSVDVLGNVYACHNVKYVLGNITDSLQNINSERSNLLKRFIPDSCFDCLYKDICQCICPFALKNIKGTEFVHCKYFKLFFEKILCNKNKMEEW